MKKKVTLIRGEKVENFECDYTLFLRPSNRDSEQFVALYSGERVSYKIDNVVAYIFPEPGDIIKIEDIEEK